MEKRNKEMEKGRGQEGRGMEGEDKGGEVHGGGKGEGEVHGGGRGKERYYKVALNIAFVSILGKWHLFFCAFGV